MVMDAKITKNIIILCMDYNIFCNFCAILTIVISSYDRTLTAALLSDLKSIGGVVVELYVRLTRLRFFSKVMCDITFIYHGFKVKET